MYVKSQKLEDFKNEINIWKNELERKISENTPNGDELSQKLYQQISENLTHTWDEKLGKLHH